MSETLLIVGIRKLGRTIALHFARQGWNVICAARTPEDVDALAADVAAAGGRGIPFVCDITKPESLAPVGQWEVDLCVASQSPGGRFGKKPLLEIEGEELARGFAVSVAGTWNLLQAVGAGFVRRRAGTFIQMGTSSGMRTKEGFAALGTNQFALRALVQVAAKDWREHGVHVAYVPIDGPIESEASRQWMAKAGVDPLIPPAEIAKACEYLHRQAPRAWSHELVLRPLVGEWTAPT